MTHAMCSSLKRIFTLVPLVPFNLMEDEFGLVNL
jgi:hypothetical protein